MVDTLNEYVRLADYAHDDLGDTPPISCGWRIGWSRRQWGPLYKRHGSADRALTASTDCFR